jgi:ethanolamine transporter
MEHIGSFVIYIIMVCAVIGAVASIIKPGSALGDEFLSGLYSIGYIFVPVAGIMASIPYLSSFITAFIGPFFNALGADPAIAGTAIIASDMGGYQLAEALAESPEGWIMAMVVGFMSGSTIIFSIPVGLAMLEKADHKYMALGVMAGLLSIPFGLLITCFLIALFGLDIRPEIAATGDETQALQLSITAVFQNLFPIAVFCVLLAIGLRFFSNVMIAGFLWFGKLLNAAIILVLTASIIEYFTSVFSIVLGSWGFAPIIADKEDQFRALEIAGYIGIMLSGAFPMVYLITHFLAKPMKLLGDKLGLSAVGVAGILAASANILAMFRLVSDMSPKNKVVAIAFAVCAAFTFGDHLAFSANFQPSVIVFLMAGKLGGGMIGVALAMWLSVPKALEFSESEESVQKGASAEAG